MRIISGKRGSGKTTKLVKEANLLRSYGLPVAFVSGITGYESLLRQAGLKEDIPVYPATSKLLVGLSNDYILFFDELEQVLRAMFRCKSIAASVSSGDIEEI